MAQNSKIEWCDHTVNLWWGCAKVHTGCKNCYAEYLSDTRYNKGLWGENAKRQWIKSAFPDLDRYQAAANRDGKLLKIFCGSMMDIFEESKELINPTGNFQHTDDIRRTLMDRINNGRYDNLVFLFLTKRPDNIPACIHDKWLNNSPKNVWYGTSISDQNTATIYGSKLANWHSDKNLFLSIEPQVGTIRSLDLTHIGWVIQGGESGNKRRPFDIQWAHDMKRMCGEQQVPYFFKQIDKIQSIPEDLQVREFPDFNNQPSTKNQ